MAWIDGTYYNCTLQFSVEFELGASAAEVEPEKLVDLTILC